jgi:hypothetical protein
LGADVKAVVYKGPFEVALDDAADAYDKFDKFDKFDKRADGYTKVLLHPATAA